MSEAFIAVFGSVVRVSVTLGTFTSISRIKIKIMGELGPYPELSSVR